MRSVQFGTIVALLSGCLTREVQEAPTPPVDAPPTAPVPTPPPPTPPASTFREGTWLVDHLVLHGEADTNGDGTDDNRLPAVLTTVDILLGDAAVSVEQVNASIENNLASNVTVVFLDGTSDGDALTLDVLPGLPDLTVDVEAAYDDDGLVRSRLEGTLGDETGFSAEGRLFLPVVFIPGFPPSPVRLDMVMLVGDLDADTVSGTFRGAIPVQAFVDDVVAPMIPPEGLALTPGTLTPRDEVLALIESLAPGLADLELPSGEPAVSAVFDVGASAFPLQPF